MLLIMIVLTLVDEVLGEGPKDLKTLMNQASSPLTMFEKPFLCMSYSTLLSMHQDHDEVVTTLVVAFVTFLLRLASSMTLPSYEGYAGGSRQDTKVDATQMGRVYAW